MAKRKRYRGTIRIDGKLIQPWFATKADRDEWYQKMRAQRMRIKAGLETEFEPERFDVVCAYFIKGRTHLETWKHDRYRIEHYFFPLFRERLIHSITRKEWKQAFDSLITGGLKPKTVNNIRTMLSTLYDFAIKDEPRRAQHNPIKEISPFPVMQEAMQFFHTPEECEIYLSHAQADGPMFGMFAFIALNTGMREGEIVSLRWQDVDLERKTIRVGRTWSYSQRKIVERTKGKKERVLGMNETLRAAFTRHKKTSTFNQPTDLIVSNTKGAALQSKHLQEMHKRVMTKAGLTYMVIHSLRHTYATQYLANGGDIWNLKNILGHANIKTTERYAHVLPVKVQARANVFEVGGENV